MKTQRLNIFLLPSSNKNNKYIDLFLSSLQKGDKNIHIYSLKKDSVARILSYVCAPDLKGATNIIHIHWPTILYGSKFFIKSTFLLMMNFLLLCLLKYIFGMKIVWTVHNFFAHDYPHLLIDKIGQRMILSLVDLVTVQQKITLESFSKKYPKKNIQFIPHGNYIDAYGPRVSRDLDLRKSFGFAEDDIVLLSLGVIAPYKLNEKIIDQIDLNSKIKLLVCGKGKQDYIDRLKRLAGNNRNIVIREGFVPDEDIPKYLSIADYSVFYYDESEMTSGGIILSLSYGIPVITRNIPSSEIISGSNGFVFSNERELKEILLQVVNKGIYESQIIIDSVRQYDHAYLAQRLIELYRAI